MAASEAVWTWCALLARDALGEAVRVKACERSGVLGLAGADERGWYIELAPRLAGDELLHALYHECGHLASGHVARGVPTRGRPVAGSVLDVLLRSREVEQEREAEAWCEHHLASVSESVRWVTRILSEA